MKTFITYIKHLINRDPSDIALMMEGFTHKSYAIEHPEVTAHNQRLEFLGDSVLGLVVAAELHKDHQDFDESQLTLWKISLVREETLFDVAKHIGLDQIILIWKGEEKKAGRDNPAILGDALEALIWYLYEDFGLETAKKFILDHIYPKKHTIALVGSKSRKSLLQEKLQAEFKQLPVYINEEIERDDKLNYVKYKTSVVMNSKVLGVGYGTSKKKSEDDAAKNVVEKM